MEHEALKELGRALAAKMQLERPLAVLDLETTDVNTRTARIVEIAVARIESSGAIEFRCRRVDPRVPIPPEATAVHGITNQDVAGEPMFGQIAPALARFLAGCDLAGFNVARFDVPVLEAEFGRAGHAFSARDRNIVDALAIYHRYEPRDLEAAVRRYVGHDIADAHSAAGDVLSVVQVLSSQLDEHTDLARDVAELDRLSRRRRRDYPWFDAEGCLAWRDDALHLNFGKHDEEALTEVIATEPGYIDWILSESFPEDVKDAIRATRAGSPPVRVG